ncbi:MAG: alpha/beta hydrolase [Clostridia bacterium]|nr:alpha/beta hydrolase [Clostridia bacterium]
MIYGIRNGALQLGSDTLYYIRFGSGAKTLIMLPGLGDGLTTVKGTALPMAMMYRIYAKNYTVYMLSRRNQLPQGYATRDMARDLKLAMDALGIEKADLMGVSMGGMIAQHFAADYPACVNKLVLVVTCAGPNPTLQESVSEWIALARRGDHTALMDSNVRRMYSESYYRKNKWLIPVMGRITKPKSYDRFLVQAQACLAHSAIDRLASITAPTLIIGGEKDRALGGEASREIAAAMPRAKLKMYPQWGHGLYEEAKDFHQIVLDFLDKG